MLDVRLYVSFERIYRSALATLELRTIWLSQVLLLVASKVVALKRAFLRLPGIFYFRVLFFPDGAFRSMSFRQLFVIFEYLV